MGNLGIGARDYITIYLIPVSYDTGYDKSVSDHVTNKNTGAYESNVIIIRSCFVVTETPQRVFPYIPNSLHKKRGY
jgi:hypothetical protein